MRLIAEHDSDTLPASGLRIVFDTNVLLSLWVFVRSPRGSEFAPLRGMIDSGALLALSNPACLAEFERVLGYPEFRLTPQLQREIYTEYFEITCLVQTGTVTEKLLPRCRDRDDQKFLELARDSAAQFLVTSDKALLKLARHRLLAEMFKVVTPEYFMAEVLHARKTSPGHPKINERTRESHKVPHLD